MKDWSVVYKSAIRSRTEIVKGILIDRGIGAVIVNKKDSSLHLTHGQVEILVQKGDVLEAVKIIKDEITFE